MIHTNAKPAVCVLARMPVDCAADFTTGVVNLSASSCVRGAGRCLPLLAAGRCRSWSVEVGFAWGPGARQCPITCSGPISDGSKTPANRSEPGLRDGMMAWLQDAFECSGPSNLVRPGFSFAKLSWPSLGAEQKKFAGGAEVVGHLFASEGSSGMQIHADCRHPLGSHQIGSSLFPRFESECFAASWFGGPDSPV